MPTAKELQISRDKVAEDNSRKLDIVIKTLESIIDYLEKTKGKK